MEERLSPPIPPISPTTTSCVSPTTISNGPVFITRRRSPGGKIIPSIQPVPVGGSPANTNFSALPVKGSTKGNCVGYSGRGKYPSMRLNHWRLPTYTFVLGSLTEEPAAKYTKLVIPKVSKTPSPSTSTLGPSKKS